MAISITTTTAAAALAPLITAMDAGAGVALCVIYSGTAPANAAAAATGTILAIVPLAKPSATVSGATLTFAGMPKTDASADASGTAGYFRITSSADGATVGTSIIQGTCGVSGTDMILASTTMVAGAAFTITAASITIA